MESRLRVLFLKALLMLSLIPGVCPGVVFAAEENTKAEINVNAKDVQESGVDATDNEQSDSVQIVPAIREDVKNIQVEQGSDQVIQPKIKRRELASLDNIEAEDFEFGPYGGYLSVEDFGVNAVAGVQLAYHISEYLFTELAMGVSNTGETSYERLSGGAKLLTADERKLTYYNFSVGVNLFPGEAFLGKGLAFNTAFYVIGGAGITRFAGDDHFTLNYGVGYRFILADWLATHFGVRDHVFNLDLLGTNRTTHNIETHVGITIFF